MQRLLGVFQGKRTYLSAALYALDAFGAYLGWWGADTFRSSLEQIMTLVFIRAGLPAKETK
jgi:hypothetical protein